jgi:uncharacterized SAM-binding protein YcdF (DUF218 family)
MRSASAFLAVLTVALAGLLAWLGREALLRQVASLWIVSDTLTHADAIVVLGGNAHTRPQAAAELYRRGLASKVLVSYPPDYQRNLITLLNLGVPAGSIEAFGRANANTKEEAAALRDWAEQHAAFAFIIPTEPFMTRRVRWAFHREFSGTGAKIEVQPITPLDYSPQDWWKTDRATVAFKTEMMKYIYYRWNY